MADICINQYGGSLASDIRTISCVIDARNFFDAYIAPRIPVKLVSTEGDECGAADKANVDHLIKTLSRRWTNSYLREVAGDEMVKVEVRSKPAKATTTTASSSDVVSAAEFGLGNEVQMSFGAFLSSIDRHTEEYYLTTQDLSYDAEDRPSIVSPPMNRLMRDAAYRPTILGQLVVQNINMWFGCSTGPSSSGLHHDYHDNLYLLLRGEKHFTLYSPSEYENLYLYGRVAKVHPNGRINYENQLTLPDGSHAASWRAMQATDRLIAAASRLEQMIATDEDPPAEDCLEDEIDDALEDALDAEIGDHWDSEIDSSDGVNSELGCDDQGDTSAAIGMKLAGSGSRLGKRSPDSDSLSPIESTKKRLKEYATSRSAEITESPPRPSNFSRIDTSKSSRELAAEFPLFSGAQSRSLSVVVRAGEMIYVPAGWFHEVRSAGSGPDGHLALNYWCHPPDTMSFEAPYSSEFWARDWSSRNIPGD